MEAILVSLEKTASFLERLFSSPRKVLFLALLLGGVFVLLGTLFCESIYRDTAHCYAYEASEFGRGDFLGALHPELPVIPVAAPGLLCLLGMSAFTATKLVCGLCYLLAAIPLYFVLKFFFEAKYAAWGALLYVLTPKAIRFSMSGLPDTYRNFFIILSIAFLLEQAARPRLWKAAAFGAALAGIALSRGEGIVIAAFQMAAMLFFVALARWRGGLRGWGFALTVLKELLVASLLFVVCMAPRGMQISPLCGYPVPDVRLANHIDRLIGLEKTPGRPAGPLTEAERKAVDNQKFLSQFDANLRGAYEFYAGLALLGAIVLLKRRKWRWEHSYLLALLALNVWVFSGISISYRYYLINSQLLMPLSVAGFVWALSLLPRWRLAPALLAIGLFAAATTQIVNGLSLVISRKDRLDKEIGDWVKANDALFRHSGKNGRLRVMGDTELDFWTGGEYVSPSSYKDIVIDYKTYQDFDAALFYAKTRWKPNPLEILDARPDVERLKGTPYPNKVVIYRKLPVPAKPESGSPKAKP